MSVVYWMWRISLGWYPAPGERVDFWSCSWFLWKYTERVSIKWDASSRVQWTSLTFSQHRVSASPHTGSGKHCFRPRSGKGSPEWLVSGDTLNPGGLRPPTPTSASFPCISAGERLSPRQLQGATIQGVRGRAISLPWFQQDTCARREGGADGKSVFLGFPGNFLSW